MPVTYLDGADGIGIDEKTKLVKSMYEALHEAYPFPDDVRIFLREWPLESVSQNGHLVSEAVRPVFMMHVPQGVSVDAKLKMLSKIDAVVSEAYRLPKFMVFIQEYPLDRVALDEAFILTTRRRRGSEEGLRRWIGVGPGMRRIGNDSNSY